MLVLMAASCPVVRYIPDKSGDAAAIGFIMNGSFKPPINAVGTFLALGEAVPHSKEQSDEARSTSETQEQIKCFEQALRFKIKNHLVDCPKITSRLSKYYRRSSTVT